MIKKDANRITIQSYDKEAENWHKTRQEFWGEIAQEVISLIKDNQLFKDDKVVNILDAGCGNGRFFKFLQAKYIYNNSFGQDKTKVENYKYTGFDPSEGLIEIANRECAKGVFFVNNLLSLDKHMFMIDQKLQMFDIIFSFAVFHHFNKQEFVIALNNLKMMKHKDSLIVMTLWYRENVVSKEEFKTLFSADSQRYVYNYEVDELKQIFDSNNCQILDIKIIERNKRLGVSNIFCVIK